MDKKKLFEVIQKQCIPVVWSKGLGLVRQNAVILDSETEEEIRFRIAIKNKAVSPIVTFWPEDEDAYCDCSSPQEPCEHIAAAAIALKQNLVQKKQQPDPSSEGTRLIYQLTEKENELHFERIIVEKDKQTPLRESLIAKVGGLTSGRTVGLNLPVTKNDFAIEAALGQKKWGAIDKDKIETLFKELRNAPYVELNNKPIKISNIPFQVKAELIDEKNGIRLKKVASFNPEKVFRNGVVLHDGVLYSLKNSPLSTEEKRLFLNNGTFFNQNTVSQFFIETLPQLKEKIDIDIKIKNPPEFFESEPKVILDFQKQSSEKLCVTAKIFYGTPEAAEVVNDQIKLLQDDLKIPIRKKDEELLFIKKVRLELGLTVGQPSFFENANAIEFLSKAKKWPCKGEAIADFSVIGTLDPQIQISDDNFTVNFNCQQDFHVDAKRVFTAWNNGHSFVPLNEGGWAKIPHNWFEQYGDQIEKILNAKEQNKKIPGYFIPQAISICEELNTPVNESLLRLKNNLEKTNQIENTQLPKDINATLRHYQQDGVNWLSFLKKSEMGALLADDMGLGKTLQAICVVEGKTLVIAPTSVLFNWQEQIEKFRPNLKYCLYYGKKRTLDKNADIIITSYNLLRIDQEIFQSHEWDTIILDESQLIKNPESQTAKATYQLNGKFKLALTGTPIENHLYDLWSQFQFLNPGLLGPKSSFTENLSQSSDSINRIKKTIKPFILRRLKSDVAKELPQKTEIILHSELNEEEEQIYQSIYNASKKEIVSKLNSDGNVLQALELILRLRQTCCHADLVPGVDLENSSKLTLLMESLKSSIDSEHKSLVFSQWTSYLDKIEQKLIESNISFLRLDGSTKNRAEIVNNFQAQGGPPILIMSLKAGGVGLNLTAADHIYITDPWWNPAAEKQAADRAHRIGQENPVFIHKLITKGTIEEKIIELQERKKSLSEAILEETNKNTSITKEDILFLLDRN